MASKKENTGIFYVNIIMVFVVAVLVINNQLQITGIDSFFSTGHVTNPVQKTLSKAGSLLSGSKGGKIVGPMMNTDRRTTKLVEWPTISETPAPKDTGNPTQDAINYIVPTGTPFYVEEGPGSELLNGITFNDPITSQKVWASFLGSSRFGTKSEIKLTAEEQDRYKKMVNGFTCDYCCGGPNQVTPIPNCGCAHSYAWQGMAKFFIKYYPEKTDEEIMGEMTK